jgi:hypothetical protein
LGWGRLRANAGTKLLALALALALWGAVAGEQKVELSLTVPVEIRGLPPALVQVAELPEGVALRIRGPRTLMAALAPAEVALSASAGGLGEGEHVLGLRPEDARVPRGVEVLQVTPNRVRVFLDPLVEERVTVFPRLHGVPARGRVVRGAAAHPGQVRIAGPRSEVRRLAQVPTAPVDLDGRTADFEVTVGLEPLGPRVRVVDEGPIRVRVQLGESRAPRS